MSKGTFIKVGNEAKNVVNIWTKTGGQLKQEIVPWLKVGAEAKDCIEYYGQYFYHVQNTAALNKTLNKYDLKGKLIWSIVIKNENTEAPNISDGTIRKLRVDVKGNIYVITTKNAYSYAHWAQMYDKNGKFIRCIGHLPDRNGNIGLIWNVLPDIKGDVIHYQVGNDNADSTRGWLYKYRISDGALISVSKQFNTDNHQKYVHMFLNPDNSRAYYLDRSNTTSTVKYLYQISRDGSGWEWVGYDGEDPWNLGYSLPGGIFGTDARFIIGDWFYTYDANYSSGSIRAWYLREYNLKHVSIGLTGNVSFRYIKDLDMFAIVKSGNTEFYDRETLTLVKRVANIKAVSSVLIALDNGKFITGTYNTKNWEVVDSDGNVLSTFTTPFYNDISAGIVPNLKYPYNWRLMLGANDAFLV